MRFSTIFATSAVAGAALAAEHTVVVGKDGLTFNPDTIKAAQDDWVIFKFWPKNHSIAQSAFNTPCQPSQGGLWSGFVPVPAGATKASDTMFMYQITNASQPLWFYCSQGNHCQEGMVGVVNPPNNTRNTLENYKSAASSAQENLSPSSTTPLVGELMNGTHSPSGSGTAPSSTGAASSLQVNGVAFTGVLGMFAYFLM